MAAPHISITEEGTGAVKFEGRLKALEGNMLTMAVASKEVMTALEKTTEARWGAGVVVTEATEERWPDWSPLYNSGALKASLTKTGSQGAIREITPYGFRWGTNLLYAKFLAKGTRKMAPKPVVPGIRSFRAVIGYAMRKYILRNVTSSL